MDIKTIRSDGIYKKIMEALDEKKNDIYWYELMMPFQQKWDYCHIPLKAAVSNGFDIIMAGRMLGLMEPQKVDISQKENIRRLADDEFWDACEGSLKKSFNLSGGEMTSRLGK